MGFPFRGVARCVCIVKEGFDPFLLIRWCAELILGLRGCVFVWAYISVRGRQCSVGWVPDTFDHSSQWEFTWAQSMLWRRCIHTKMLVIVSNFLSDHWFHQSFFFHITSCKNVTTLYRATRVACAKLGVTTRKIYIYVQTTCQIQLPRRQRRDTNRSRCLKYRGDF